jgi:hypothetical protein
MGSLSVRRPISSDLTWSQLAQAAIEGDPGQHSLILRVLRDFNEFFRWTFRNGFVSRYEWRVTDDGRPVEVLTMEFGPTDFTREVSPISGSVAPGGGFEAGYNSELAPGIVYRMAHKDVTDPLVAIVSPAHLGTEVVTFRNGTDKIVQKLPGLPLYSNVTVRQNPSAKEDLFPWFRGTFGTSTFARRDLELRLAQGGTVLASLKVLKSWPYEYSLYLADDGLPVEDFSTAADSIKR